MQHEKSPTDKPAMAALPSRRADGSEKEINAPGYNISSATLHEETSLKRYDSSIDNRSDGKKTDRRF